MIKDKKIFITGGAGFIGSALVGRLVHHNHVVVYDNLFRNSLKNKSFKDHRNLTLHVGDVRDYRELTRARGGVDIVIHCAGIAGVSSVLMSPSETWETNLLGSVNVLKAARQVQDIEKIICFSTGEVFGPIAFLSTEENATTFTGEPRWVYAVSKLAAEHLAMAYYREEGLPVTVVRPFNIYGPGQTGDGAIRNFITQALRDEPLRIHGDGLQIRAWCYIDDCVEGTMLLLEHENVGGEVFNIGNQKTGITVHRLAKLIKRLLDSKSPIQFVSQREADVAIRVPSVDKIAQLGFDAEVDLEEGIQLTAEYFRENV